MSVYEGSVIPTDPSDFACIDFINSTFSDYLGSAEPTDRLGSPQWLQWFLERYELTPDSSREPPFAELIALRRDVRRVLEKWSHDIPLNSRDLRLLDQRLREAPLRMRVARTSSGLDLRQEPLERSWQWVLAGITGSALELQRDGDPARFKTCDNPDCSWAFYDNTINRSKRFCSTSPCGLLIRVRRFRRRS
jgi:predicted RNA-binding Zn ribbon-like protein